MGPTTGHTRLRVVARLVAESSRRTPLHTPFALFVSGFAGALPSGRGGATSIRGRAGKRLFGQHSSPLCCVGFSPQSAWEESSCSEERAGTLATPYHTIRYHVWHQGCVNSAAVLPGQILALRRRSERRQRLQLGHEPVSSCCASGARAHQEWDGHESAKKK